MIVKDRARTLIRNPNAPLERVTSEPFHETWMAYKHEPRDIRLARSIVAQRLGARRIIKPNALIVGQLGLESIVTWSPATAVHFDHGLWEQRYAETEESERSHLEAMRAYWRGRTTPDLCRSVALPEEESLQVLARIVGAGCHSSPMIHRLLTEGTVGLRRRVEDARCKRKLGETTAEQEIKLEPDSWGEACGGDSIWETLRRPSVRFSWR